MVDGIKKTGYMIKPHFLDGRDATNVKPEMSAEWLSRVRESLTEKISNGYNNGRGEKGNYIDGDDIYAVADSTSRAGAGAPGHQCYYRQYGENTENPELSYTTFETFAYPSKINLYC